MCFFISSWQTNKAAVFSCVPGSGPIPNKISVLESESTRHLYGHKTVWKLKGFVPAAAEWLRAEDAVQIINTDGFHFLSPETGAIDWSREICLYNHCQKVLE